MKRRVRLFIGGLEVEFKTVPDILYNFQVDSLTDPAAVKNSYSKTIQIPSTAKNDRIFDNFFLNDYRTGAGNFDASKKTEFTLYVDSDVYETGYCRLDGIAYNKHYREYTVSLFGGLGEFFYNLSFKDNPAGDDEKMKLSDINFYSGSDSDTPQELGFTINKETIAEAWEYIDGYSSKWSTINFASCYNGVPDDFDANKVLMNVGGVPAPSGGGTARRPSGARTGGVITSVTEDDKTYRTYEGYALAELSREYTASEMREFRSYLMRPCLRVKKTIESICRPENNGGWQVELDSEFFNTENCYYEDLWMTLPLLSTLDYTSSVESTGTTASLGAVHTGTLTTGDPGYYEDRLVILSDADSGNAFDINVKISLDITGCTAEEDEPIVICEYYPSYRRFYISGIMVQLVAYDGFGTPVAGSDEYYITSAYGARRTDRSAQAYVVERDSFDYRQPYGNGYVRAAGTGSFSRLTGTTFRWGEEISLTAKNVPAGSTLKILVTKVYKAGGDGTAKTVFWRHTQPGTINTFKRYAFDGFNVTLNSSTVAFKTNEGIRTGAAFTKKQLLDTDFSPADFLLSYMKLFGLYAIKDTPEKKIKILSRKNFFKRGEIVDIEKLIDRSSMKLTPLVFNSKWYSWNLPADESEYGKAYETTYGKPYGQRKINTGYGFNRETKEVLQDNIFRGAVQVLERSDAFCFTGDDTKWKPWMSPGYKYLLYNIQDNTDTYEMDIPASSTIDAYSAFTEGYLYYDLYDKAQLHSADNSPADGNNVLLIRSGNRELSNGTINLNYFITDDNTAHTVLNAGRPCWLFTNSETDINGNSIATRVTEVPYFSRYKIYPSSGYIVRSMDYGKPEEIYIPNAYYRDGSTLYEEFWESYISDLYSKDSRVLTTKMLIREMPSVDWLRRFYAFDGAIWRMTAINDYNVADDKLTEVQFVKVQDVENYTNEVISENPEISLTLSDYELDYSGGTIDFYVSVSDGGSWYVEHYDMGITPSVLSGTGDFQGTITVGTNPSTSTVTYRMVVYADNSSASVTITQTGVRLMLSGPIEQGDVPWTGGTRTFRLVCPDSNWSAMTPYTGIITSVTPTMGTATDESGVTITVGVGENDFESRRQAYIHVFTELGGYQRSSWITQLPANDATISVTPNIVQNFSYNGGTFDVLVYCTEDWDAYLMPASAITASTLTGHSGETLVTVTVAPNDGAARTPVIQFNRIYGDNVNLYVFQQANPNADISISPQTVTGFTAAGGEIYVQLTATTNWKGYHYTSNLMANPSSGTSGTTEVTMTVTPNTTGEDRTLRYEFYIGQSPSSEIQVELEVQQYGD